MICEVCEKRKRKESLFSFDGIILFCKKCAIIGIKKGETPLDYLYKYKKGKFIKIKIKDLYNKK